MPRLEPHDELGLPWDELADGRVHRLVKGREFVRGAELVEEAAANAAARLERVVRTYREIRHGVVYLWVQFVHHEVVIGDPCPCGEGQLLQVNLNFAECSSCKATVALITPKRERQEHDDAVTEDEPLLLGLFGAQRVGSRNGKRATRRAVPEAVDPKSDLTRLGAYSKIVLYPGAADAQRERLYGHALAPGGHRNLLVVDLPLVDGTRIEDSAYPGGWRHAVWSVPTGPFQSLIRLEELGRRDPAVRIDDPFGDGAGDPPGGLAENGPAARGVTGPPDTLEALEDVQLFPYALDDSKKGRRFCGYACTSDGETVLLTGRYTGREEESAEQSVIRCVPLEPFGGVIDVETLFASEPGLPLFEDEPHRRPAAVVDPKSDLTRLGAFTNVELYALGADERRERMYGHALGPRSAPALVVVDFPLAAGSKIQDEAYPGGWRHTVWWVPIAPFARFVRVDELRQGTPALRIEDPLANFTATPPTGAEQDEGLPRRLSELEDVQLFRHGGGKKRDHFFGYARTTGGEQVLVAVRVSQREDSATDPEDPSRPPEELRTVPLEPFEGVVDTDALFSHSPADDGDADQPVESLDSADTEGDGANGASAAGDARRQRDPNKAERRATRPKGAPRDAAQDS